MKILFLTPFLPSKIAGGHNYTRLLLKQLAECGCDVDLLYCKYPTDPYYENPDENHIKVIRVCKISSLIKLFNAVKIPFFYPIFTIRFSLRNLFFLMKKNKEKHYDVVYLDHPQMYLYGKFFKQSKILMAHDVMAQRYERVSRLLSKVVMLGEKYLLRMPNSTVFSFSIKDQVLMKNLYGIESKVTNFFMDSRILQLGKPVVDDYYVFFGKWDRNDNLDGMKWFFTDVYPLLGKDVKVKIIGVALPLEYQQKLKDFPSVDYLGFVDNPYEIIANAKAMLAPLFSGAGVKVKVIESLACGTPVVGSEIAFEGISREWNDFMILANDPSTFASAMKVEHIGVDDRILFRTKFLEKYNSQSVIRYFEGCTKNV